jgi:hypothetical protein
MKILSRIVLIFIFPAAIILWPIGWSLFWIGSQKKGQDQKKFSPEFFLFLKKKL